MIRVLYDYLCFNEKYGGVSKYFVKMPQSLPPEISWKIPVMNTNNEYIKELKHIKTHNFMGDFYFKGKWRITHAINRTYAIKTLLKGDFDIYYQTHYDPYAFKYLARSKKKVTTMHDMNFFVIPDAYNKNEKYIQYITEWQKISAFNADKIVAPSNNTKKDLMDIWNISDTKITVVYPGNDAVDLAGYDLQRKIEKPYILFVGTRCKYKNFDVFLEVFKILQERDKDLCLVCTGAVFTKDEISRFEELKIKDKAIQIPADETLMVNLYYNAECFVYPSLYEGFGLPLIEAMSCNCPVACSNTSCFPEVAGDAAAYFDPYSIENMAETISALLRDSDMRNRLIANGHKRQQLYTWQKCADKHVEIYRELMG